MQGFTVVDVAPGELEAAYFLVRAVAPETTPGEWLAQARAIAETGGALGLASADGTLFGLLTFRKRDAARHGSTFAIENLVALELARTGSVRRALLDAAYRKAESLDCTAISFRSPGRAVLDRASA